MTRPMEVRLVEYRDSLRSQANQLEKLSHRLGGAPSLDDTIRMFRIIANDLTKVIDGVELEHWTITGVMPVPPREPQ